MLVKAKVAVLLSLVLLVILWKKTQGRCFSCPRNDCSQTEMPQGKCFRARYYTTTHLLSRNTITYYTEASRSFYYTSCGFWGWSQCKRYYTIYYQRSKRVEKYIIRKRENLACDAYCCLEDEKLHEESCYSDGNVRLAGGTTTREGRVEIWYSNQWNTICDDLWDINDAHVVCRQLGYEGAVTAHQSAHFGQSSGQVLLDDLRCTGREASLLECSHRGINNHNCSHSDDARVTCTTSNVTSGTLRLTNGFAPSVGRVEVWYSDQWNTVCDGSWSNTDARVACRQLGYQGAAIAHQNAHFGEGSGGILLNNLNCTGAETSLLQCSHNGLYNHSCDHDQDAAVTCVTPPSQVTDVSLTRCLRRGRPCLIVRWTAPQSNLPISLNRIQYKRTGAAFWGSEAATAGPPFPTSVTLISLAIGTNYTVRVSATSSNARGEWSEEQTERTYTYPSRVTNVSLTIIGAMSLNVTWAIPQSDLLITQYQVQYRTDDTSWSSAPPLSGSPPSTSTVLNGMHAGCIVRVRALSDVGGGEWSPEQMLVVFCDKPESPANGGVDSTGNTEGYTASYFCNSGFTLSGDRIRTCQSDGQWSGTQPQCTGNCDEPQSPANGSKNSTGNTEGQMVNYFCNPGFILSGDKNRTCQPDGQWSGTQPLCIQIIDGGWSFWVNGTCSVTCGEGVRVDTRKCDNPPPQNGGKDCKGSPNRTGPCFTCPCKGGWSAWFSEPCSRTCGGGTRYRSRNCTTPNHLDCCPGNNTDVETCGEISCPIDGGWSPWFKASNCSVPCGGGTQLFVRKCNNPVPANGGKDCEGPESKNESCEHCPCEGGWSPWSHGPCSHTCGNGTRTSTRSCTTPDHPDCCPGNSTTVETCGTNHCPDINCDVPLSPANGGKVTTGTGRSVGDIVSYFCNPGFKLSGDPNRTCQLDEQWSGSQPNCIQIIDGGWSPWVNGTCSNTCGEGVRVDTRTCDNPPPLNGGKDCYGSPNRARPCFTCPCEGGWSPWSHGPCSHTCGNGTRTSTRNCTTPDHPDCCPGNNTIVVACVEDSCPIHGNWSHWMEVLPCNKPCGGGGFKVLRRECNNPEPANGGNDCVGERFKIDHTCADCPCKGGWSPWSHGPCSHTCGNGTRTSTRNCTTPDVLNCCPGSSTLVEACEERNCSVDGGWSPWREDVPCSKSCGGGGVRVLVRDCNNPAPANDGKECEGEDWMVDTTCADCPSIDGGWSSWKEVAPCNATCGGGTRQLMRMCNNPAPANGGRDCEGKSSKTDICAECPCDAGWSSWTPGACTGPCGQNGTAVATRKCNAPSQCCRGEKTRTENCTIAPC